LSTVTATVGALAHLNKNYSIAPELVYKPYNFNKDHNNEKFVQSLIYSHKNNQLYKSIGDTYIKLYKPENPAEQAIWTSDCERLTFYVRLAVNDTLKWIQDKKGIELVKMTIKPLLLSIRTEVEQYYKNNSNPDKIQENPLGIGELLSDAYEVQCVIDSGKLGDDILKYVSAHFDYKRQKDVKLIKLTDDKKSEKTDDKKSTKLIDPKAVKTTDKVTIKKPLKSVKIIAKQTNKKTTQ
jgi:hypothetical protein